MKRSGAHYRDLRKRRKEFDERVQEIKKEMIAASSRRCVVRNMAGASSTLVNNQHQIPLRTITSILRNERQVPIIYLLLQMI